MTAVLGGAFLVWAAWQLRHPAIGFDSALYHYPEVADWIAKDGRARIQVLPRERMDDNAAQRRFAVAVQEMCLNSSPRT